MSSRDASPESGAASKLDEIDIQVAENPVMAQESRAGKKKRKKKKSSRSSSSGRENGSGDTSRDDENGGDDQGDGEETNDNSRSNGRSKKQGRRFRSKRSSSSNADSSRSSTSGKKSRRKSRKPTSNSQRSTDSMDQVVDAIVDEDEDDLDGDPFEYMATPFTDGGDEIRVLVVSFNVGNREVGDDLRDVFPHTEVEGGHFDLVVIGLQESVYRVKKHKMDGGLATPSPAVVISKEVFPAVDGESAAAMANGEQAAGEGGRNGGREGEGGVSPNYVAATDPETKEEVSESEPTESLPQQEQQQQPRKVLHAASGPARVGEETEPPEKGRGGARGNLSGAAEERDHARHLQAHLQEPLGESFEIIAHVKRVEMQMFVFARTALSPLIREVQESAENTGFLHLFPNKGGLCVGVTVDHTKMAFVSCHLAAHEGLEKCKQRNQNIEEIFEGCRFGGERGTDLMASYHHVFVFGDLNYRVDFGLEKEQALARALDCIERKAWAEMMEYDELERELRAGNMLNGFEAAPVNFEPTFKRLKGEIEGYLHKRVPSYTDRVLHYSMPANRRNLNLLGFDCVPSVYSSDHKPVRASFAITPTRAMNIDTTLSQQIMPKVVVSDLHGRDLTEMDPQALGGGSDPYIRFYTEPPDLLCTYHVKKGWRKKKRPQNADDGHAEGAVASPHADPTEDSHRVKRLVAFVESSVITHDLNPNWADVITFYPMVRDMRMLDGAHLVMTVWDKDFGAADDLIGTVLIPFRDIVAGTRERGHYVFEEDLLQNGLRQGRIGGRIEITSLARLATKTHSIAEMAPKSCCALS